MTENWFNDFSMVLTSIAFSGKSATTENHWNPLKIQWNLIYHGNSPLVCIRLHFIARVFFFTLEIITNWIVFTISSGDNYEMIAYLNGSKYRCYRGQKKNVLMWKSKRVLGVNSKKKNIHFSCTYAYKSLSFSQ